MALRALRALRLPAAASVACVLLLACGSDSKVKSFTLEVEPSDTVNTLFQRGLARAVDLCAGNDQLLQVKWTFSGDDVEKPVVQDYTSARQKYPTYITCDAVKGEPPVGATVTTLASSANDVTADDQDMSSRDQDQGGKSAETSSSVPPTSAATTGPSTTTTVAP